MQNSGGDISTCKTKAKLDDTKIDMREASGSYWNCIKHAQDNVQ
jgi:hypothetical protein